MPVNQSFRVILVQFIPCYMYCIHVQAQYVPFYLSPNKQTHFKAYPPEHIVKKTSEIMENQALLVWVG